MLAKWSVIENVLTLLTARASRRHVPFTLLRLADAFCDRCIGDRKTMGVGLRRHKTILSNAE